MGGIVQAVEILEHLVGFDTTSHKSNRNLVFWVKEYLAGFAIDARLLPNKDGDKFNLIATLGPPGDDGMVLSGHTDVVPVEGQIWATDPFKLTQKNGHLYGRGSCDMKGVTPH